MAKSGFEYIWSDKKRTLFGLPWSFTRYFLTENKFVTRTGMLSLSEDEFDLYKVTDKKLLLPFWQRIFGCGSILIYVRSDTDTPEKEIHCIKNPRGVLEMLDKQIDSQRDRYSTRGRDLYGGGIRPHHMAHDMDGDCDCDDDCDCRR